MSAPSLHRKLAEVYAIVERIPKNGTADPTMGGYKFVQVGDAADPIRKALSERQVTMLPTGIEIIAQSEHEDSKNRIVTTCDVRTTWTFTDGESGETAVIQSMGSGQDRGDKYVPKALTNSMKYAILLGFLMPTGDDPEASVTDDRTRRAPARPTSPRPVASSPAGAHDSAQAATAGPWEGAVTAGKAPVDLSLRETANGKVFGFVLLEEIPGGKYPRKTQVVCEGPLADAVATAVAGMGTPDHATVWGAVEMVPWQKDGQDMRPFRRVHATRVMTPEWTIPATDATPTENAAPGGSTEPVDDLANLPW